MADRTEGLEGTAKVAWSLEPLLGPLGPLYFLVSPLGLEGPNADLSEGAEGPLAEYPLGEEGPEGKVGP